jgi:hypothetical protein
MIVYLLLAGEVNATLTPPVEASFVVTATVNCAGGEAALIVTIEEKSSHPHMFCALTLNL